MLLRRHKDSRTETPVAESVTEPSELEAMTVEQLKEYAERHEINIGNATSVNGIIKKIQAATNK